MKFGRNCLAYLRGVEYLCRPFPERGVSLVNVSDVAGELQVGIKVLFQGDLSDRRFGEYEFPDGPQLVLLPVLQISLLSDLSQVREKTGCLLIVVQKEGRGKILQGGFVYLFNSGILCGFFVGAFGESPK